jgi:hypothetical protein
MKAHEQRSLPPFYAPGTTSFYTSSSTQYQNAGGSGAETTTYSYTFFPDNEATGAAIETETTALPAVPTADGGTGSSPTSTDVYNSLGQLVWSQDANGSISYTAYDPATGAVNEQIQDVNFGASYNVGNTQFDNDLGLLPESWGLPTTGKNLVTTYHVDSQGRTIEEIDPDGDVTCRGRRKTSNVPFSGPNAGANLSVGLRWGRPTDLDLGAKDHISLLSQLVGWRLFG